MLDNENTKHGVIFCPLDSAAMYSQGQGPTAANYGWLNFYVEQKKRKKRKRKKQKLRTRIELRNSNFSGVFLRFGKYSLLIERGSAGS